MGVILGNYGNEKACTSLKGAQKGPNGEWAVAVEYALFYRNGTFPYSNCGEWLFMIRGVRRNKVMCSSINKVSLRTMFPGQYFRLKKYYS